MRPTYIKETLCNFQKILVKETPAGHLDKFGNRGTANMSKETHRRDLFKLKDTHRRHPYWRSRQTEKCQICPRKKKRGLYKFRKTNQKEPDWQSRHTNVRQIYIKRDPQK